MSKFIVAQLGARMHYAVPRIFHQEGMLERFYTDICGHKGPVSLFSWLPRSLLTSGMKRLFARVPHGLPPESITTFTSLGIRHHRRLVKSNNSVSATTANLWCGKRFCELVNKNGFGGASDVYTFNSAGLEILEYAKKSGLRAVMEQTIVPYRVEQELLAEECKRFPGWQTPVHVDGIHESFADREENEWREADLILCGSDFVRKGIASRGGPVDRCMVVPYGVNIASFSSEKILHKGPLRVLTVGAVGLRKGTPYVLAAAQKLQGKAIFRVVGPLNAQRSAFSLSDNVEMTGAVPRSEVRRHFLWADIFLLPSICEGSATVTYEAFAAGLPVICTPNTGSVVTDGEDGFIVPIRNSQKIVEKIMCLSEPDVLQVFSRNAIEKARFCDIAAYSQRLLKALKRD